MPLKNDFPASDFQHPVGLKFEHNHESCIESLFSRLIAHTYRWSQTLGGDEPHVFHRKARFFLDDEHDFVLEMAADHLARIKVCVLRVVAEDKVDCSESEYSPKPYAAAKVRNFIESVLCDLRETWMRRMSYTAVVQCVCDRPCHAHNAVRCHNDDCLHFLSLDQCLSNKIVCCDYRRVPTSTYRKGFPSTNVVVNQGPVLSSTIIPPSGSVEDLEVPGWVKSCAKMLNGGIEGQDWLALAKKLGYKRNAMEKFSCKLNPGLALLTDWIISSGNTALSIDLLISCLEQLSRDDIVEVVQKGREAEVEQAQIFISYQWDNQDEVTVLRDVLEKNGFTCWMDIGQMGGGDHLYNCIYDGIKNAKVVIACLTPRYIISHHCNKEIALADVLHKPIIPVMYEAMSWPPGGAMSLIFAQLVYVNLHCVGGHGGSGIHADIDDKYREIVTRVSNYSALRQPRPVVPVSPRQKAAAVVAPSVDTTPAVVRSAPSQTDRGPATVRTPNDRGDPVGSGGGGDRGAENPSSGAGEASARRSGSGQVQPVSVTKCTVCTIL